MAVRHCADLNLSVSAVGRMSRQFDDARSMVENLRVQVGSVGDSLRLGEVGSGLVSEDDDCYLVLGSGRMMIGLFPVLIDLFEMFLATFGHF